MFKSLFPICVAASFAAGAQAATVLVPDTTIYGTDVFSGPSFVVSGNFSVTDTISVRVDGTVDLAAGSFTANAAGVIVSPPTANTGGHPGETSLSGGFPYAALLIGNSTLGYHPLFLADAASGLGNSTPPTALTTTRTLGDLFGSGVTSGTVLEFRINDINTGDNSGGFRLSALQCVPDAGSAFALLGGGLSLLGVLRRKTRV
jgi:hypothetical protein